MGGPSAPAQAPVKATTPDTVVASDTAGLTDAIAASNAKRRRRGRGSIITSGLGTSTQAVVSAPTLGSGAGGLGA